MKSLQPYIAENIARLERGRFFREVTPNSDLRTLMSCAPFFASWVMTFQDVIRFNADLATDPRIKQILEQHLAEDSGHERWFLADVETLFPSVPMTIDWLFSPINRDVRRVSAAISSEVFRIASDPLRLVFVEVLEATAGACFAHTSRVISEAGHAGRLKFFAGVHLVAEAAHEMHQDHGEGHDAAPLLLPDELVQPARDLIRRVVDQFDALGNAVLDAALAARR